MLIKKITLIGLACAALASLAGCGSEATMDTSSDEAFNESTKKIFDSLPPEKQLAFNESLYVLRITDTADRFLSPGADGRSPQFYEERNLTSLEGKNAEEIIALGKEALTRFTTKTDSLIQALHGVQPAQTAAQIPVITPGNDAPAAKAAPTAPPPAIHPFLQTLDRISAAGSLATANPPAVDASTAISRLAIYLEGWQAKVQRLGALNGPVDVQGARLQGKLLATASIGRDGTVLKAVIDQSSGNPVLDEAARQIIYKGAPYSAFPEGLAAETGVIDISRTWIFTGDGVRVE